MKIEIYCFFISRKADKNDFFINIVLPPLVYPLMSHPFAGIYVYGIRVRADEDRDIDAEFEAFMAVDALETVQRMFEGYKPHLFELDRLLHGELQELETVRIHELVIAQIKALNH